MAENDNNQQFVENVDSNQLDSVFEQEQNRMEDELMTVLYKSEEIWNVFNAKRRILGRLYKEQIATSDNFTAMNFMKRDYRWFLDGNIAFLEIDEEANYLLPLLEDFENKLDRTGKIIRDFIRDMQVHLAKIRNELNTVQTAETVEDMAEVDVPNLEWVESTPDPEIEQLADFWDMMQLMARTNHLLTKLTSLI